MAPPPVAAGFGSELGATRTGEEGQRAQAGGIDGSQRGVHGLGCTGRCGRSQAQATFGNNAQPAGPGVTESLRRPGS